MRLRGGTGKWLMKKALRGTLPDEILYRKKMGFVSPIASWFRGPLLGDARRVVARLNETGWFAPGVLDMIVNAHQSGKSDHGRLLWQLVMFEKSMTRLFS
jgi:asparagine synthase (glutamine-hydrolysing)